MTTKESSLTVTLPTDHDSDLDFRLLFESSPTPHMVVRADPPRFTIIAASDSYLSTMNKTRSALIGLGVFDAFPENPVDTTTSTTGMNDLRTSFERTIQTGKPDVLGVQRYDIPKSEQDVTEFEVKYWSPFHIPIMDKQGKVAFIMQRVEDVTEYILLKKMAQEENLHNEKISTLNEQKEAEILKISSEVKKANRQIKLANEILATREQELAQLNERLTELDRVKTEFFSNVSHEFRTPLTLMLGPIEDLLSSDDLSANSKTRLEVAQRNALRLLKLVNTLLDFSRLEAGRIQISYTATDLRQYTKELASHFDSAVEKAGIKFIVDCEPLPELIYIDPDLWDKIVFNLLSNAFKFTFTGTIKIQQQWINHQVVLTVQDTGIGIAPKELSRLFERFYRVANVKSRSYEGSGIGLSLVKELVHLHYGTIEVCSIEGKGTTFTVTIPSGKNHLPPHLIKTQNTSSYTTIAKQSYIQEAAHWLTEEESLTQTTTSFEYWLGIDQNENRKAVILLVDDNLDMRNYIGRQLQPFCEVKTAIDGINALELMQHFTPDLILSDIMMPNMNGFELLTQIRKNKELQFISFILISARAGEEAKVAGLHSGADDYLVKPFSVPELLARVKTNLDHQRSRSKINRDLIKLSEFKSQFISNMSHELRTPLNAIIGYSEMILKGMANSSEKLRKYSENISLAGRHLLALINDILDLSKIEAGKIDLKIENIELKPFLTNIHALMNELAQKKQIKLYYQIEEPITQIKADKVRLKQVLINLINNAIKFNKPQGWVEVKFYYCENNSWLMCQVKDSGIGILENKLVKLFSEFYQIESSSSQTLEGTGLGLALSKKIVQLHGGSITVESEVGVGSTFTFSLPSGEEISSIHCAITEKNDILP